MPLHPGGPIYAFFVPLSRSLMSTRLLTDALKFDVARQPDQFRDFVNFFLERQLREIAANFVFHYFGIFKLCRRRMSSSNGLSIFAWDMSCSIRAKSLCLPTLAAM